MKNIKNKVKTGIVYVLSALAIGASAYHAGKTVQKQEIADRLHEASRQELNCVRKEGPYAFIESFIILSDPQYDTLPRLPSSLKALNLQNIPTDIVETLESGKSIPEGVYATKEAGYIQQAANLELLARNLE
ncbi:hypothetical protein C4573_04665 [Candidatus Woesearchaeota archaeon]|nr:MAG: hypothetical protein C4573_04665 [Candidatus Woesearchaeota archaeon]